MSPGSFIADVGGRLRQMAFTYSTDVFDMYALAHAAYLDILRTHAQAPFRALSALELREALETAVARRDEDAPKGPLL